MTPEPRAGDVIRNVKTGEIRTCIAWTDSGHWDKQRVWQSRVEIFVSGTSSWTKVADWEIAYPGHAWEDRPVLKKRKRNLTEI